MFSDFSTMSSLIISEISSTVASVDTEKVNEFVEYILNARQIFCFGAGRSGIILKTLCMRLNHLGINAFFIGGIPCPPADSHDLLLCMSGSGETGTVISLAKEAKNCGCKVAAITTNHDSTLKSMSDVTILLKAPCHLVNDGQTMQPMRTLFEQVSFILCETISLMLKSEMGLSNEDMARKHANLE